MASYITLSIPNKEVAYIYENMIQEWFSDTIRQLDLTPFVKAMETGDCDTMADFLCGQLENSIRYFDGTENFDHGFFSGILACVHKYILYSNIEAGLGRGDILLKEKRFRGKGIIFELKYTSDIEEMDFKCDEALKQIEEKRYEHFLQKEGCTGIQKYGICFFKKGCLVKTNQ